jgi:hypothetical protein
VGAGKRREFPVDQTGGIHKALQLGVFEMSKKSKKSAVATDVRILTQRNPDRRGTNIGFTGGTNNRVYVHIVDR